LEVSVQVHAPAALLQGKEPLYSLDRRLGGPQSQSGRHGEEKILALKIEIADSSEMSATTYETIQPEDQSYRTRWSKGNAID
jgi:hypothetical protein